MDGWAMGPSCGTHMQLASSFLGYVHDDDNGNDNDNSSLIFCQFYLRVGLDEAEAGVLVEVRAEVEAREAGGLVACVLFVLICFVFVVGVLGVLVLGCGVVL
jgi:hypothetical protein